MQQFPLLPNITAKAYFILKQFPSENIVFVSGQEEELSDFADAIAGLGIIFPQFQARTAITLGEDKFSRSVAFHRILENGSFIIAASPASLALPALSPETYIAETTQLKPGQSIKRSELIALLEKAGYERTEFVEQAGEYSIRGSVVDIFCAEPAGPVRLFFSGDKIDFAKTFDIETQHTEQFLDCVSILPLKSEETGASALEWLKDFKFVVDETALQPEDSTIIETIPAVFKIGLKPETQTPDGGLFRNMNFQSNTGLAAKEIERFHSLGYRIIISCINKGEAERLIELFAGKNLNVPMEFTTTTLREGFYSPEDKLAILTSSEIFSRNYISKSLLKKFELSETARIRFKDLKAGDYVVHEDYGIGKYLGLKTIEDNEDITECLSLEYKNLHKLFVPLYDFKKIQKYVGGEGKRPRLSSLSGRAWNEVKARVKKGLENVAKELLRLEASRAAARTEPVSGDSRIEEEFAETFPYEETADQAKAINAVLEDMQADKPMDRVIAGDVGFGKTEVAIRAALRCALSGKQAIVVVPTTILAAQHYRTFKDRLAGFPVNIAMLCRFQSKQEQKKILEDTKAGIYDIIIGTHRLLSKDVKIKNLGLCIIDEEHRFGVKQKEKIKALSSGAHTLMLSATPIPRTLYQAIASLRNISVIETPPSGRIPITTKVLPWNEKMAAHAITEELLRGGQVFYVHNRVKTLPARLSFLNRIVPEAKVCVAHGQMKEGELEKAMWDFLNKKYDILLSSTIIESGLDIPKVNTLIIENAHEFGLAQLYQLRGRIGRGDRKAACYLFYPEWLKKENGEEKKITEDGYKRLSALTEFGSLGSGFRLAMRDMEIRGAGELLGTRQHGFINEVGLTLYCELLANEIKSIKGQKETQIPLAVVEINVPAYIPVDYLPDENERLNCYKKFLSENPTRLPVLIKELEDMCGPAPSPVKNLAGVMQLRKNSADAGIRRIEQKPAGFDIYFRKDSPLPHDTLACLLKKYQSGLRFLSSPDGDGISLSAKNLPPFEFLSAFLSLLERKC